MQIQNVTNLRVFKGVAGCHRNRDRGFLQAGRALGSSDDDDIVFECLLVLCVLGVGRNRGKHATERRGGQKFCDSHEFLLHPALCLGCNLKMDLNGTDRAAYPSAAPSIYRSNSPAKTPVIMTLSNAFSQDGPISLQSSHNYLNFRKMVPLARLERALLAELDFESSASTNSTTGALWLCQLTVSEIGVLLANRLSTGNAFSQPAQPGHKSGERSSDRRLE